MSKYTVTQRGYRALVISKFFDVPLNDALNIVVLLEHADKSKREGLTPKECRERVIEERLVKGTG